MVKSIDSIIKLEVESKYVNKMLALFDRSETTSSKSIYSSIKRSVLEVAMLDNRIVSCEINSSGADDLTGYIQDIGEEVFVVQQITQYGEADGVVCIKIDDITQLCFASRDEIVLERLSMG